MVRDDKYDDVSDRAALSVCVRVSVGLGVTDVVRLADASFVPLELRDEDTVAEAVVSVVCVADSVLWCWLCGRDKRRTL